MTPSSSEPTTRVAVPMERAQLVWRRAVVLADLTNDDDRFRAVLELLRTARYGPSTMLHALALGRTQLRTTPGDAATQHAIDLLTRTIGWLGKRTDEGEIGTANRLHSSG